MRVNGDITRSRHGKGRGVQPERDLQRHIMGRRITLDELFVEGRSEPVPGSLLADMRMVARCRLIGTFIHARDPRDKKAETDNYFISCGGSTVGDLVRYVMAYMPHSRTFVRVTDLPAHYTALNNRWREMVRQEAGRLLLMETLIGTEPNQSAFEIEGIFGKNVLYDECLGLWLAGKALVGEYEGMRGEIGRIVEPKKGRPQTKRPQARKRAATS